MRLLHNNYFDEEEWHTVGKASAPNALVADGTTPLRDSGGKRT